MAFIDSLCRPSCRAVVLMLVPAGGDVFVSHGAPLLHGIEMHQGKPILHGLGSLVFHSHTEVGYYPPTVWESAIVHLDFVNGGFESMEIVPVVLNEVGDDPARQWPTRGRPRLATGIRADRITARLMQLSAELGVDLREMDGRGYYP